jgi:thiol-disulfide isomerase/thioredoxin
MRRFIYFLVVLSLTAIFAENFYGKSLEMKNQRQVKVRAPELEGGRNWLNIDKPLSIAGLRGKVVLLDFWTYGCINCIHIIPDLKRLEAKYSNNLVVIGVHSAKFDNEGETENIRKIILRYGIEHPVVNDANFKIWKAYTVRAYPTQVLIDPAGYIVNEYVGEGHAAEVDYAIGNVIAEFRKKGKLNEQPLKLALERAKTGALPLAFPGKVLADEKSNRLFISDSNHNRIIVTDLNGKLLEIIGNGKADLKDGDFREASFKNPQGLFLDGETLYVADTQNHAIRRVILQTKQVETISGDGRQSDKRTVGGDVRTTRLTSPWDLVKVGNALYIAMAGSHQIWKLDFDKQTIAPFAGTGAEARFDARIEDAGFAQPSGIVSDGKALFIADSESNIIRRIDLEKRTVETLVGGDLWKFGDRDGKGDSVRLQHPLGVTLYDGKILIADTYNHKIKQLDAEQRTVKTFLGSGKFGQTDGANPTFYEPGGLSIAAGKLYVADTNNQAIRVVDLNTNQVATLKIEGLTPPAEAFSENEDFAPNAKEIKLAAQEVSGNSEGSITFQVNLPQGYHVNTLAPNRFEIATDGKNIKVETAAQKFSKLPLSVPFQTLAAGATNLKARLTVYYCRDDNTGACLIKTFRWQIPVKITANSNASNKIELSETIKLDN